jgi:hypothetical protein
MQLILLTHLTTSGVLASQGGSPSVQTSSIGHVLDAALLARPTGCAGLCSNRHSHIKPVWTVSASGPVRAVSKALWGRHSTWLSLPRPVAYWPW